MKNIFQVALASILITPTNLLAKDIECKFHHWKGAQSEDAAISWIGTGFIVDEKKMRIKRIFPNDANSDWVSVEKKETKNFNTYVFYKTDKYKGMNLKTTYGYRVYETGKCSAVQSDNKYTPIMADGRTVY
jgi:hypothetical protein